MGGFFVRTGRSENWVDIDWGLIASSSRVSVALLAISGDCGAAGNLNSGIPLAGCRSGLFGFRTEGVLGTVDAPEGRMFLICA